MSKFSAVILGYPIFNLDTVEKKPSFISQFPAEILHERQIIPIAGDNNRIYAVLSDPFDISGIDELRIMTGKDFDIALADSLDIARFSKEVLGLGADTIQSMFNEAQQSGIQFLNHDKDNNDLEEDAGGASIIHFVNQILTEAIEMRATDVHIEPFENELRVRYRVDGVLKAASIPEGTRTNSVRNKLLKSIHLKKLSKKRKMLK